MLHLAAQPPSENTIEVNMLLQTSLLRSRRCPSWYARGAVLAMLVFRCLAADDKKPDPPTPVKVVEVYSLPFFCIPEDLGETGPLVRLPDRDHVPYLPCDPNSKKAPTPKAPAAGTSRYIVVPAGNADDVATQLQPQLAPGGSGNATVTAAAAVTGTASATATGAAAVPPNQFALTATADKRSVIVFCRERECAKAFVDNLNKSMDNLALPKFAHFKDRSYPDEQTAKALAKAVPVINGKLTAELVDSATLRVESSKPLSAAEVSDFESRLQKDQAALAAGPITDKDVKADLAGAPPDTQVIAMDLPFFCQADDLQTEPQPTDKDTCDAPLRRVQATNFDTVVQAVNSALSKSSSKLTVSKDGAHILIACDTKCSGDTLQLVQAAIASAARPVPLFVHDIPVPRGTEDCGLYSQCCAPDGLCAY
jgi:hypothetical protein